MKVGRSEPVESRLSDLVEFIQYGYTAKSSAQSSGPYYLRITDVQNDAVDWSQVPRVAIGTAEQDDYLLRGGDIVFARSGATVGKSFLIRDTPDDAIFASYLIRVRCNVKLLDPEYAALFFKSEDYWKQIRAGATGTGQPNFNGSKLGDLRVPMRPLSEQRSIVAKIKKLFSRSMSARIELAHTPRLIERYKQAVLTAAFHGTLTDDWRERHDARESGADLVKRITQQCKQKQLGKKAQSKAIQTTEQGRGAGQEELPRSWQWATIESVGIVMLGRQRSPANHVGPYMRPYLRAANITWDGLDLSDVKEMNFDERDFGRFKLQPGDVLVNEGSGSADEVGKPAIWKGEIEDCCFQNTLVMVRPYLEMSEYTYFALLHAAMTGTFVDETRGVNINHIGRQGLAEFPIAIAPLDEQREIVSRVRAAFASIERVRVEMQRASALIDRFEQRTLAKAFRGELLREEEFIAPVTAR